MTADRVKIEPVPAIPPPTSSRDLRVEFVRSGSTILDLALGGGWALRRINNIVGDKSTGKTLLEIEALANFKRQYPTGDGRYAEAESAFDEQFAATLGFPDSTTRPDEPLETTEEFEKDLYKFVQRDTPGFYVLDSLDALTDDAEVKKFEKVMEKSADSTEKETGSYGAAKAKEMSKLFRMLTRKIENSNCALSIVSQIRDNIGVMFGETKTRSGGRALDFYASQIVWLAELQKLTREVKGQKMIYGVSIEANVKKCKVGLPFRRAQFDIIFGYGVDDEMSMLTYLTKLKEHTPDQAKELKATLSVLRQRQDRVGIKQLADELKIKTVKVWNELESAIQPPMRKYE